MGKIKFYDVRHLLRDYPDAYYYVIFGERSNGKTYSALDYALERYSKTGEQFAYIRRWHEDIRKKNLTSLFSSHVENGRVAQLFKGEWNQIHYGGEKFYLEQSVDGDVKRATEPCGFAFDLNSMEHYKSISFPKVTTVIFDEFMSRNGYLPNEFQLFANALSTIIRYRSNVKILMLGNTVNRYCIYFTEMGLTHIKDQKIGTVDVYRYGETGLTVVTEYTGTAAKHGGKPSDVYFSFDNPELKMITGGAWEIAIYPHLEERYLPKEVLFNFFVDFDGDLIHGEIISKDTGPFIFIHRKTTPIKNEDTDIVYTAKPSTKWNYKMCLTKQTDRLSIFIMRCLRENRIFYSTNEVGEVFRNYVIWSDSYSIKN